MLSTIERLNTAKQVIDFTMETCCSCGIPFFMPTYKYKELVANKGSSFYCPNGHGQHYSGKSEADKLRDELKRKEQELADVSIEKVQLNNKLTDANKKLKRLKNGVCPCCNRTFENLLRHMKTQHPEHLKQ